jgi:hypothetical protein
VLLLVPAALLAATNTALLLEEYHPSRMHAALLGTGLSDTTADFGDCTCPAQVVDLSHNKLELVPADLGWLGLSQLKLEGNSRLRIPHIVQQRGFK